MATKNALTNQKLGERFENAFTLVNYAIEMAKTLVQKGEELSQNPANIVLDAIAENRDLPGSLEEKKMVFSDNTEKEPSEEKFMAV
ncbi:MAG: hypothetical protein KDK55_03870 [Chlamydiia bacterium]|nr:hypothetical protein [Chlamydiia bacterium]